MIDGFTLHEILEEATCAIWDDKSKALSSMAANLKSAALKSQKALADAQKQHAEELNNMIVKMQRQRGVNLGLKRRPYTAVAPRTQADRWREAEKPIQWWRAIAGVPAMRLPAVRLPAVRLPAVRLVQPLQRPFALLKAQISGVVPTGMGMVPTDRLHANMCNHATIHRRQAAVPSTRRLCRLLRLEPFDAFVNFGREVFPLLREVFPLLREVFPLLRPPPLPDSMGYLIHTPPPFDTPRR